jgi:hypothetical protein
MYRLLRIYGIASFASMLVAAMLLVLLYRAVAVEEIIQLTQKSNLALAQTALNAVKPDLVEYLAAVASVGAKQVAEHALPERLGSAIAGMMQDTTVARIKIYNQRGVVVFSTKPDQAGETRESNGGFESAIKGRVASNLIYRGSFNLSGATEDDNLMSTYIPVRRSPADAILGVFEIYSDVENLVMQNEQAVLKILAGVGLTLALLYVALLLVARRATRAIELQQLALREQSATVQAFYGQLLKSEEVAKTEIVANLHKGLAQTLEAIKILLKRCREQAATTDADREMRESIVATLRSTIGEIQSIATCLQQSSPDDFRLRPAVDLFCGEFEHLRPGNLIEQQILLPQDAAPAWQKIIMYQIVDSAFRNIAQFANADQIQILLRRSNGADMLSGDNSAQASSDAAAAPGRADANRQVGLAQVLGRMAPPGGTFTARRTDAGGIMLRASWTK